MRLSFSLFFFWIGRFCEPLIDSYNYRTDSFGENQVQFLNESSGSQKEKEAHIVTWRILKSNKAAHILRRLFSRFIREIVEGMIGYVHLPTIMSRLLSDNGSQEFGDFKLTILGMLGTFGFERRILVCVFILSVMYLLVHVWVHGIWLILFQHVDVIIKFLVLIFLLTKFLSLYS